jgi:hypothetical protein
MQNKILKISAVDIIIKVFSTNSVIHYLNKHGNSTTIIIVDQNKRIIFVRTGTNSLKSTFKNALHKANTSITLNIHKTIKEMTDLEIIQQQQIQFLTKKTDINLDYGSQTFSIGNQTFGLGIMDNSINNETIQNLDNVTKFLKNKLENNGILENKSHKVSNQNDSGDPDDSGDPGDSGKYENETNNLNKYNKTFTERYDIHNCLGKYKNLYNNQENNSNPNNLTVNRKLNDLDYVLNEYNNIKNKYSKLKDETENKDSQSNLVNDLDENQKNNIENVNHKKEIILNQEQIDIHSDEDIEDTSNKDTHKKKFLERCNEIFTKYIKI